MKQIAYNISTCGARRAMKQTASRTSTCGARGAECVVRPDETQRLMAAPTSPNAVIPAQAGIQ